MLTFINASILTALIAVSIPILIHLFNKQKKKKIFFSTLRFLRLLEKKRLKRIKIYEYLLIVLRTLVILTLILAFARPTLTGKPVITDQGARTTAVIILDTGLNMRAYDDRGNRFTRAIDILHQLTAIFNNDDQVYFICSSAPDDVLDKASRIEQTNGEFTAGEWIKALSTARQLFKDHPNYNHELYLISDFQFSDTGFEKIYSSLENVHFFHIQVGNGPVENSGIDTVIVKNQIFEINKPIGIEAYLSTADRESPVSIDAHLFVDNKRVSHKQVTIAPGENMAIPFSFQLKSTGLTSGYVEIGDDDLLADNRYHFALNMPANLKVLYVDDAPSPFFRSALTSLKEQSNITFTTERYATWARNNFQQFDIILLADFPNLPVQINQRLRTYLQSGKSIFLFPGLHTVPSEFNQMMHFLGLSVRMKEFVAGEKGGAFIQLADPDLNNPLFSGLFRRNATDLTTPRFYQYFKFITGKEDQSLLLFKNNDPFVLKAKAESGTVFCFSSYIDDQWTDFHYRGLFLPVLSRLFYLGAANTTLIQTGIPVNRYKRITLPQGAEQNNYTLRSPDNEETYLNPEISGQELSFKLSSFSTPGIFRLFAGKELAALIPVNVKTKSLFSPPVDLQKLSSAYPAVDIYFEADDFGTDILNSRYGSELWKTAILLTILLLILEIFFIKKTEGKAGVYLDNTMLSGKVSK